MTSVDLRELRLPGCECARNTNAPAGMHAEATLALNDTSDASAGDDDYDYCRRGH